MDGDSGPHVFNEIDFGALYLIEELSCVGRERLDVAPLPFSIDSIERKRRLAGPGESRDADKGVVFQIEIERLKVILSSLSDDEF